MPRIEEPSELQVWYLLDELFFNLFRKKVMCLKNVIFFFTIYSKRVITVLISGGGIKWIKSSDEFELKSVKLIMEI